MDFQYIFLSIFMALVVVLVGATVFWVFEKIVKWVDNFYVICLYIILVFIVLYVLWALFFQDMNIYNRNTPKPSQQIIFYKAPYFNT